MPEIACSPSGPLGLRFTMACKALSVKMRKAGTPRLRDSASRQARSMDSTPEHAPLSGSNGVVQVCGLTVDTPRWVAVRR